MPDTLAESAIKLALQGLHIFPITPGRKAPPLIKAWQKLATTDLPTIRGWWLLNPHANIGCHVGASGHIVFDIDVKNGVDGFATLAKLGMNGGPDTITDDATDEEDLLPPTGWNVETPSGGLHIWYKLPKDWLVGNSVGKLGPGLDVRSTNGYVLMPPSKLDEWETPYTWIPPLKSLQATGS